MVSLCAGGELHPNSWRVCKQAGKAELFREDTSDVRADAALQILSCQLTKVCNMSGIPATEQFWCEGLLGCPLHCKSHLAAFYNGSPDVTFGRELQMATMWEGYCAFDAICTVINSVKKKKKSYYQCYIVLWCLIHEVWFWGLADYLHVRLPSWRPRFGLISGEKSKPEVGALLRDEKWIIINK